MDTRIQRFGRALVLKVVATSIITAKPPRAKMMGGIKQFVLGKIEQSTERTWQSHVGGSRQCQDVEQMPRGRSLYGISSAQMSKQL